MQVTSPSAFATVGVWPQIQGGKAMSDKEPTGKSEDLTAEQKFKTLGTSLKLVVGN
jgi:hypothetical protein